MSATTGNELRPRMGFRQRARQRRDTERIGTADEKLAAGRALVRPAVAACVTLPASWRVAEQGSRLDASIRAAGFVPLRLDLAQDSGFAAAAIPLGVGLPDRRGRRCPAAPCAGAALFAGAGMSRFCSTTSVTGCPP